MVSSCNWRGGRSGNAGPHQLVDPVDDALCRLVRLGHGPVVGSVAHGHVLGPRIVDQRLGTVRIVAMSTRVHTSVNSVGELMTSMNSGWLPLVSRRRAPDRSAER